MTSQVYAKALKHVLVHEGGKVDDPQDPGGRTNQGVIQRVYDGYRARKGRAKRDVWQMEPAERDEIYRFQYWDVVRGNDLPAGVDYVVFDGAVNSGPSQSVKWLQRALGTVTVDGQIGEATLAAVAAHPDHDALIAAICARRIAFLKALKTWRRFGTGWSRRVAAVKAAGQAWASGSVGPQPVYFAGGHAKATIAQAKPLPVKSVADASTGAGIGTGSVAGLLEQARQQLDPLAATSAIIGNVVTALVVTGVLLAAGGIAYRFVASWKTRARADALDLPAGVAA